MNSKEAKQLKVGMIVIWEDNQDDTGEIIEIGNGGFRVTWKKDGFSGWIDFETAGLVTIKEKTNNE